MYVDHLEHHGVKGMRWGHRKDGKPQGYQGGMDAVKRLGSITTGLSKAKKNTINKASAFNRYMKRKQNERKMKLEQKVQKKKKIDDARLNRAKLREAKSKKGRDGRKIALTTHSPKELAKYQHLLSDEELKQRYNRLKLENDVKKLTPDKSKRVKELVDSGTKVIKAVGETPLGQMVADTGQAYAMQRLGLTEEDLEKAKGSK